MLFARRLRRIRIFLAAAAAILFIGKQDHPDGMTGVIPDSLQRPQYFYRLYTTLSIVHCTLGRIPGIEMTADRNILIREFRSLQLTDNIMRYGVGQHVCT